MVCYCRADGTAIMFRKLCLVRNFLPGVIVAFWLPPLALSFGHPLALSFEHLSRWTKWATDSVWTESLSKGGSRATFDRMLSPQEFQELNQRQFQELNQHQPRRILTEWNDQRAKMKERMESSKQRHETIIHKAEDSVREELRSRIEDLRTELLSQTASKISNEDLNARARQSFNEHIMQTPQQIKGDLRVLCQKQQEAQSNLGIAAEELFAGMDEVIRTMAMLEGPDAPYSTLSEFRAWASDNMPPEDYQKLILIMQKVEEVGSPSYEPDPEQAKRHQHKTIHQPLEKFRRDMKDQMQDLRDSMEFHISSYT